LELGVSSRSAAEALISDHLGSRTGTGSGGGRGFPRMWTVREGGPTRSDLSIYVIRYGRTGWIRLVTATRSWACSRLTPVRGTGVGERAGRRGCSWSPARRRCYRAWRRAGLHHHACPWGGPVPCSQVTTTGSTAMTPPASVGTCSGPYR